LGVKHTKHIPMHPSSIPTHILHQRKSVAAVQTCGGLFGLGPAEIAIIVVAGAFVLGPQKLGELVKSSGKMVMEFKEELNDVPAEFKKGLEEGEVNARSRKAKEMKKAEKED
jgi:sec-independent protein translocase protein TatA